MKSFVVIVIHFSVLCPATQCYGNRQDQFPPGNLFVAVSEGLWDNGAACGRRYRMRCLSGTNKPCKDGTIDVEVVDICRRKPCSSTIILSRDAFAAISRYPNRKINIEYIQYVISFFFQVNTSSIVCDSSIRTLYVLRCCLEFNPEAAQSAICLCDVEMIRETWKIGEQHESFAILPVFFTQFGFHNLNQFWICFRGMLGFCPF